MEATAVSAIEPLEKVLHKGSFMSLLYWATISHGKPHAKQNLTFKITGLRGFSRRPVDCRVSRQSVT
jgi:hypothetical protein